MNIELINHLLNLKKNFFTEKTQKKRLNKRFFHNRMMNRPVNHYKNELIPQALRGQPITH